MYFHGNNICTEFQIEKYISVFGLNKSPPVPEYILLVFNRDIYDFMKKISNTNEKCADLKLKRNFFDFTIQDIKLRVFLTGDGAPIVAHTLEILINRGAKFIIGLGYTSSINPKVLRIGDYFIPKNILRTDGLSRLYIKSSKPVFIDYYLLNYIFNCLNKKNNTVVGLGCSTDSYFRHSSKKISKYLSCGVLALDMESGAFMSVTNYYGILSILVNIVSEEISHQFWNINYPCARKKIELFYNELPNILSYINIKRSKFYEQKITV